VTAFWRQRGGWLWPAVFVASALGVVAVLWQLSTTAALMGAMPLPGDVALAASASTVAPEPSRATPLTTKRDQSATGWPTREATPDQTEEELPGSPQQLIISRLGLEMPIVATTVDDAGLMALPDRPTKIGWYSYGPRPGATSGSAVLGGHIDTRRYGIGPLAALRRLSRGDEIVVRTATGSVTYEVRSVHMISKRALPLNEIFDQDGPPRLRIVSCGGAYLPAKGGYQDNIVITAVPR
jgi:sortase (surface protein transpeptidase)